MKMAEIKEKAKQVGVKSGKKDKMELIREIQLREGNAPCFQSEISSVCAITNCLWKDDCYRAS